MFIRASPDGIAKNDGVNPRTINPATKRVLLEFIKGLTGSPVLVLEPNVPRAGRTAPTERISNVTGRRKKRESEKKYVISRLPGVVLSTNSVPSNDTVPSPAKIEAISLLEPFQMANGIRVSKTGETWSNTKIAKFKGL